MCMFWECIFNMKKSDANRVTSIKSIVGKINYWRTVLFSFKLLLLAG